MKKVSESEKTVTSENDLFSLFSEEEILSPQAMMRVRGGDGDGSIPIIIIPPPPPGTV